MTEGQLAHNRVVILLAENSLSQRSARRIVISTIKRKMDKKASKNLRVHVDMNKQNVNCTMVLYELELNENVPKVFPSKDDSQITWKTCHHNITLTMFHRRGWDKEHECIVG